VNLFKWPSAVLAALVTPLVGWALLRMVYSVVTAPAASLIPFGFGLVAFVVIWRRWLGQSRIGAFLVTLEHESTHSIFALLTGHSIVGFRASLGEGGHVRFAGKGNWLIIAAPYFFPTAALILLLLAFFMPFSGLPWQSFMLGLALGYHLISSWRETHRDQTDLAELGRPFCWLFLPAANLAVVGLLIAFSYAGAQGTSDWWAYVRQPLAGLLRLLGFANA
jgi:hypothetical protein